jgi:hypothetical protein
MPINFIPNDPMSLADLPMRSVNPRPNRPANRARFTFTGSAAEGAYDFDTPEFLFWQCREAALAAVETWEDLTGKSLSSWQPGAALDLIQDAGADLNAYYNRSSLSFYHFTAGGKTFFFGASTDVVAHEAGHACLDSLRPELWNSALFEVNAFHEAFGDCLAILTALADGTTRGAVVGSLTEENPVELVIEYLAEGIRKFNPNHNAAVPRRARNTFQWQLPSTLPDIGSAEDGPGVLVNEIHSFGQIFVGCFYDTIVNIFQASGGATAARLQTAAQTAGQLLVQAVGTAPQKPRFYQQVGRAMILADEQANAGSNRDAIRQAFEGHGVALGTAAMLAPVAALAGAAPAVGATGARLSAAARKDLMGRIGGTGKLSVSPLRIGATAVAEAVHERRVRLDGVSPKLRGVVALAPETTLVGASGGRAAVLGAVPEPTTTADEVETFVRSLVKQGAIEFESKPKKARPKRGVAAAAAAAPDRVSPNPVTHAVRTVGGQKTLVRLRFACGCRRPG